MKKLSIYSWIVILIFSLVFPWPYFWDVSAEDPSETQTTQETTDQIDIPTDQWDDPINPWNDNPVNPWNDIPTPQNDNQSTFIVTFKAEWWKFDIDWRPQTITGSVNSWDKVNKPKDPIKSNYIYEENLTYYYTFEWRYIDESKTNEYDFSLPVTWNITLYAKWETPKYNINFNCNWWTSISSTTMVVGYPIDKPEDPLKTWHNFIWRYTDESLTNKYDFNKKVYSDITLYAKREPRKDYSWISYTACDMDPWIVHDSNLTVNYTDPNGNNFKAWTITISDGQDCITMLDRNLWASEAWVGTGYSMPKVNWYDMDQWVISYARYDSEYYWYKFQRWNNYWFKLWLKIYPQSLDTDASTIKFSETPAIYNNYWPGNRYNNDTFRITYNENGAWEDDYWSNIQHYNNLRWWENDSEENGRWLYLDNDEERQWPCPSWYHVPSAWEWNKAIIIWSNYHKNRNNNIYTATTWGFWPFDSHISVWEINKYDTIWKNSVMLFQEDFLLPSEWDIVRYDRDRDLHYWNNFWNTYKWSYWTSTPWWRLDWLSYVLFISIFEAWIYAPDNTSSRYKGKNIRCFKNKQEDPTPTTHTVTFESNWWSPTPKSQTVKEWEKATKPSDPSKNWYIFKWRYSNSSLTTAYNFSSPVTKNITLYAKWETNSEWWGGGWGWSTTTNTYTVTFESNWWTSVSSKRVQDWDYVYEPSDPTMKWYTFDGWFTKSNWWSQIIFPQIINKNTTYYAQWIENSYTIKYNLNGGNGSISNDTVDYSERIRLPSSPTRDGYTFDGWNTRSNGRWTSYRWWEYVSKLADRDGDVVTLYAQRKENSDSTNDSNTSSSNISISLYNSTNPVIDEWIWLIIKTDTKYTWIINFWKLQYYSYDTSNRINLPFNTKSYISDYDDYIENWYRMTSNDYWYKIIQKLIKFKKEWNYKLYVSDKNWNETSLQFYVKSSETKQNNTSWYDLLPVDIISWNIQNLLDTSNEVYIARSCKQYKIQYNAQLWVFTSPNLNKNEYFVNKEYFKRYIDSKNKWKQWCPTNGPRISTSYIEKSTDTNKYIAPNGKVYFISIQNWLYISNELNSKTQTFWSLSAIKYFIRDRNPLIGM